MVLASATALEAHMGDQMREAYGGMASRKLVTVLAQRRKSVSVTRQVVETWLEQYGKKSSSSRKRGRDEEAPASSSGVDTSIPGLRQLVGHKAVEEACSKA